MVEMVVVVSSGGLGPENDCAGKAQSNCEKEIRPLVKEGASH
jgi:hypothetical protein